MFYCTLDVLDGNSDPLSTGGTSGNDGSSDNDQTFRLFNKKLVNNLLNKFFGYFYFIE